MMILSAQLNSPCDFLRRVEDVPPYFFAKSKIYD